MNRTHKFKITIAILCTLFLGFSLSIFPSVPEKTYGISLSSFSLLKKSQTNKNLKKLKKFTSKNNFKSYLIDAQIAFGISYLGRRPSFGGGLLQSSPSYIVESPSMPIYAPSPQSEPERYSETLVQVPGVDELDILKTDGKQIYYSPKTYYRDLYKITESKTKIIKAFPPQDLRLENEIKEQGDLLLEKTKNVLVIFSNDGILGYDVSNPQNPIKKWEMKFDNSTNLVTARLFNGKIYIVTQSSIDITNPCPIIPLYTERTKIEIKCNEIYHPEKIIPVDSLITAMVLEPSSGKIENKIAFTGIVKNGKTVVYMSKNNLYIAYSYPEKIFEILRRFINERGLSWLPISIIQKINKIASCPISDSSKINEAEIILKTYYNSLDDELKTKISQKSENEFMEFLKMHIREFGKTEIVKIGLEDFQIKSVGEVPGYLLNQFSLDEYQENLRVAVTVGENLSIFPIYLPREFSLNDVYILDKNLEIIGRVLDLGKGEKIYAVRFIEDKGYVVTFREIDPFYVIDLSNPRKPQMVGELKIPGFSSYLHPITKDKILGVGKESSNVKISLFDVSNPRNPIELDKYILDETWTEIAESHHAFLMDDKHQVFFVPTYNKGYIFSYKDNKLASKKEVDNIKARRAIYIDDYLYIIGDEKIVVLDENTWEIIKEYSFTSQ